MDDEQILLYLVDDLLLDLCFEMHQEIRVEGMSLDELYGLTPIEREVHNPAAQQQSLVVSCLRCKRQVHASRYAPHLEKCMAGNRRQTTAAQRQYLADEKQLQTLHELPLPNINAL